MRFGILIVAVLLSGCPRQEPAADGGKTDTSTTGTQARPTGSSRADSGKPVPGPSMHSQTTAPEDTLEGTLYISGNEPFTRLTLGLGPQKAVYLDVDSTRKQDLWNRQGSRIRVIGTVEKSAMGDYIIVRQYSIVRGK